MKRWMDNVMAAVVAAAMGLGCVGIGVATGEEPDAGAVTADAAAPGAPGSADESAPPAAYEPSNEAATREVGYLGVTVEPLGETLRAQLDLPEGVGLSVAYVVEGSPADRAGLRRHDVVSRLDEQLLVSTYQMKVLVRVFGPGAEAEFEVIRRGKKRRLPVTIGGREVSAEASRLRPPEVSYANAMNQQLAARVDAARAIGDRDSAVTISSRQMSFTDGEHKLIVREDSQGRYLRAINRAGEVLFDGYLREASGEDLAPALQQKLERLEAIQQRYPTSERGEVRTNGAGAATPNVNVSPAAPDATEPESTD